MKKITLFISLMAFAGFINTALTAQIAPTNLDILECPTTSDAANVANGTKPYAYASIPKDNSLFKFIPATTSPVIKGANAGNTSLLFAQLQFNQKKTKSAMLCFYEVKFVKNKARFALQFQHYNQSPIITLVPIFPFQPMDPFYDCGKSIKECPASFFIGSQS